MKKHYLHIVKCADQAYERTVARICVDPDNIYRGATDDMTYLIEPGSASGLISYLCSLYVCEDSQYHKDEALLAQIINAAEQIVRTAHPDGTSDLLITNFYTPATFELQALCRGYRIFKRHMGASALEKQAHDAMLKAVEVLATGCLNGGFHTPNHRWVECAALVMSYNILGWPELMDKVRTYLSEGIDCDEYGEFTERSVGVYNPVNVNSMLVLAEEGNMPELYKYARLNLDLTFMYLDSDGSIFTKNSRRQDKADDITYPEHRWYSLYLWAGELFDNDTYLKFADTMLEKGALAGRGMASPLWLYMDRPQLKTLEKDVSQDVIPEHYHAYYPNSNIVRVRKGDFTYTLLANNPDFLHVKFGKATLTARMCSSFFAVAQFAPKALEKTDTGYRMTFSGHGEYKGLFPTPPQSPDWDRMDHSLRPVLHSCELDYTLDVTDVEDGVKLNIRVDNTPRVPFKLEFSIPAGTRLETNNIIMDTVAGGSIVVKSGNARLENVETGSEVTIQGLFGAHMYHKTMRGSIPPMDGAFSLYATGFTPISQEITLRFSKRRHARAFNQEV